MKTKIFTIFFLVFAFLYTPKNVFAAVTFSLNPVTKTASVNDTFDVEILLDTGGQTIVGGSAVLTYDSTKLQVIDADNARVGVQIYPGVIFTSPVVNSVDSSAGKITIDYGKTAGSFSSSGNFGKMTFKAVAAGLTSVSFLMSASSTSTASAVYAGGVNVLAAANSGSYTISSSVSSGSATLTPTPSTVLPKTGVVEDTIMLVVLGGVFLTAGFFFLAKSRV